MHHLDASSVLYAWENYPINLFPKLWNKLEEMIRSNYLSISKVALNEIENHSKDCNRWLRNQSIATIRVDSTIIQRTLQYRSLLGITNKFGKGVGENDLIIIATASVGNAILISDEHKQPNKPKVLANYKIPAVCRMNSVNVECINFLDYINRLSNLC